MVYYVAPVMIFGELLMFVQVVVTVVTFMHVRQRIYDTWRVAHIRSRLVFRAGMRRLRNAAERDRRGRLSRRQTITARQLGHRQTIDIK